MNKKSNLLLGFVKLLLYFCTEFPEFCCKNMLCVAGCYRRDIMVNLQCQNHGKFAFCVSRHLHRAKNIYSNQHLLKEEQTNIQKAPTACKYPNWAINRMKLKIDAPKNRQNNKNNRTTYRSHITVPYNEGLSESIKSIGKRCGIQVHFKNGKNLKDELVAINAFKTITRLTFLQAQ